MRITLLLAILLFVQAPAAADEDLGAIALADSAMAAVGGEAAWEQLRYLRWRFLGGRLHHWDRWTGDVRIESEERLVLMNTHTKQGRVWENGVEIEDPKVLLEALELGYAWWVNDSYWLIMPTKFRDPGVVLGDGGLAELPGGDSARVLVLTFEDGTGLTPRNRYDVWLDARTKLVRQWAFYRDAEDEEPVFVGPWDGWTRFGGVMIATDRGRGADWEISVPLDLPRAVFESP